MNREIESTIMSLPKEEFRESYVRKLMVTPEFSHAASMGADKISLSDKQKLVQGFKGRGIVINNADDLVFAVAVSLARAMSIK